MVNFDYLYNPDAAKPHFEQNYFSDKKLGFQVIERGTILPNKKAPENSLPPDNAWIGLGGIVDNDDRYIMGSHLRYGINGNYTLTPESIKHSPETVIYLGVFHRTWGHQITDCICRLWFLKSEYFSEFKDCPLVYIPHGVFLKRNTKNFMRLLEIFGIDIDKLRPITEPTQFDKIILPDESYRYSFAKGYPSFFTNEHRKTFDRIKDFALKNRTPTSSKKIYYYHGRYNQFGEERIAEYFKSKGYEVVRPELLTTDEQLNLLINVDSFAATFGSISHNSLFLREGTETIFHTRAVNQFTGCQGILNQVNNLKANYVDSNLSIFSKGTPRNNCFIISEQLKRFFGDKWDGYDEEDFKIFLQYVKKCLSYGIVVNPDAKKLYGKVLEDFMVQLKRCEDLIAAYNMPPHWEEFKGELNYQIHVKNKGWGAWLNEEQISGFPDQQLRIEAIKIKYPDHKIYYSVYYNEEEGWSEEVSNGEQAGTTGKAKPIYGIKIWLDERGAKECDILYRVHKFDGEWTDWAKNGEEILSQGIQLNAIQIKVEPVKAQIDEVEQKKSDDTPTPQPDDAPKKKFDATWTLEVRNDDSLYLKNQRQDITQIKL